MQVPGVMGGRKRKTRLDRYFWPLMILGIAVHVAFAVVAGNRVAPPWSGVGDNYLYITLAQNIVAGNGYTFAHQPTAHRAPLYTLLVAALMWISPGHWLVALHVLQCLAGILTAFLCGRLAERWFGPLAGRTAVIIALFLPTLLYFTSEVMTECFAALLTVAYLFWLDEAIRMPSARTLVILGVVTGAAALERFNAAALVPIAVMVIFKWPNVSLGSWKRTVTFAVPCALIIAPWVIHMAIAFHGRALYSTHGGIGALEGVLMPQGRAQPGETEEVERVIGWNPVGVETDNPVRPELRDEVVLDRRAWNLTFGLWRKKGFRLVPITAHKVMDFWLSTDQVFDTRSFSWRNRLIRWAGVATYWIVLLLAVSGWWRLRESHPNVAHALLLYTIAVTLIHMPVPMSTRLRAPLFDPLLAALASGAFTQWL